MSSPRISTITHYESLSGMLATMVSAAEQGNWDQVAGMEPACKPLIEKIRAASTDERLSEQERKQKVRVIKKILQDDARLRELATPWMARLQEMLTQSRNGRAALDAYRG